MKFWFLLTLVVSTAFLHAQESTLRFPNKATWVEESTTRGGRDDGEGHCNVVSVDGSHWRCERVNNQADIEITICQASKVVSSSKGPAPKNCPGVEGVREIYSALNGRAKFEVVDIMNGVGFSRYLEKLSNGGTRTIWLDRSSGFLKRVITKGPDGSIQQQDFRLIEVDVSTSRRLFDTSSLVPFFSSHLDHWYEQRTR